MSIAVRAYLLDTFAVFLFWVPVAIVYDLAIGLTWLQIGYICIGIGITDLMFGGLYGRFVNIWRKRLNYV